MEALPGLAGAVMLLTAWLWLIVAGRRLGVLRWLLMLAFPWVCLLSGWRTTPLLPRLLVLMGSLLLAGGLLWLRVQQPQQFEQLVQLQWLPPTESRMPSGLLAGQEFMPDQIRIEGSHLILAEHRGTRELRSLRIRLAGIPLSAEQSQLQLLPGDPGPWPELLLQWGGGSFEPPQLLHVRNDYSLDLRFQPRADGALDVRLHLQLPAELQTRVSGEALLAHTPGWLRPSRQLAVEPAVEPSEATQPTPVWQRLTVDQLLEMPAVHVGRTLRLTTTGGRVHQGWLRGVSHDQRILLELPQGPNQVVLHFFPLDIARIEVSTRD